MSPADQRHLMESLREAHNRLAALLGEPPPPG